MRYDSWRHHRRSLRVKGFDYASTGAYFVTICTKDREDLLGRVLGGEMILNDPGEMIVKTWHEIPQYYQDVNVDCHVAMPNHFHGIIMLVGAAPCGRPDSRMPSIEGQPRGVAPTLSLPDIVHRFKTLTTYRYQFGVKQHRWPSFPGKLWQRNYYERIIRNDDELDRIRQYIQDNPMNWDTDPENV